MITESSDNSTPAIISPVKKEGALKADVCIMTFSHEVERFVIENYADGEIASLICATGRIPVFGISRNGKRIAFYKTFVGARSQLAWRRI